MRLSLSNHLWRFVLARRSNISGNDFTPTITDEDEYQLCIDEPEFCTQLCVHSPLSMDALCRPTRRAGALTCAGGVARRDMSNSSLASIIPTEIGLLTNM